MGKLSTHVLDTATGRPAAGVAVRLSRIHPGTTSELYAGRTNADGRTDGPLLEGGSLLVGTYELSFDVGAYFGGNDGFLSLVTVRFTVSDPAQNYHVPLLASPWSYTTYRGS
ncbi:MAG: hydroxyisourate hydrolase [Spirochaetaceae bacterium]|nr:MAG: hydroxyisourate hydrolase [Spirochaetaceae bacterium]